MPCGCVIVINLARHAVCDNQWDTYSSTVLHPLVHGNIFAFIAHYSIRRLASADSIAVFAMFGTFGMVKAIRKRSTDLAT